VRAAFDAEHATVYGYSNPDREAETVALRVRAVKPARKVLLEQPLPSAWRVNAERRVFTGGRWRRIPVVSRDRIGKRMKAPALIVDYGSTVLVPAGWSIRLDSCGTLVLTR
jgi:N-methylhydantoinase A